MPSHRSETDTEDPLPAVSSVNGRTYVHAGVRDGMCVCVRVRVCECVPAACREGEDDEEKGGIIDKLELKFSFQTIYNTKNVINKVSIY